MINMPLYNSGEFEETHSTSAIGAFIITEKFSNDKTGFSFSSEMTYMVFVGDEPVPRKRDRDKWSMHYDSERVAHLRGMRHEFNRIGAHRAVISTKGPVRPTRMIYPRVAATRGTPMR